MTQMIEVLQELVMLSCPAEIFFSAMCCFFYKWLQFPNPMEPNHLQKVCLTYTALARATVNQSKRKINYELTNYSHRQ